MAAFCRAGSILRIRRFKCRRRRPRPPPATRLPAIDLIFSCVGNLEQKSCLTDGRCLEFATGEGYFLFAALKRSFSSLARALGSGLAVYPIPAWLTFDAHRR